MFFVIIFGVLLISISGEGFTAGERISGGETANTNEFPFSVALLTNAGQGSYRQACGGVLLTHNATLSAASCFYTDQEADPASWWRARVGSAYGNSGGTIYNIRRITTNPGFSPTTLANNLAVVHTTLLVHLVPGAVEVARLAGALYTFTTNEALTAIGYGVTSNQEELSTSSAALREVEVFVIDQQTCSNRYSEVGVSVTQDLVCAGWLDVGVRGQCQGDSGSPLLSGGTVVAIFSRAEGCGNSWYPAINTRLAPYLPWIVSTAHDKF